MQEINYENLIQQLLIAVPEFRADEEDINDHRGTFVLEDLARFVKTVVEEQDKAEILVRIFRFIEAAARSSDSYVLDAIRYSFLEALADSPYHLNLSEKYFGSKTRKLLKDAKHYLQP